MTQAWRHAEIHEYGLAIKRLAGGYPHGCVVGIFSTIISYTHHQRRKGHSGIMNRREKSAKWMMILPEITQKEFCDHIDDEDFCEAYGNPVVAAGDRKYIIIAWRLYERMMNMIREPENTENQDEG